MTAEHSSSLGAASCAVACIAFWVWLVAIPVARSFEGGLKRAVAVVLTGYTLFVGVSIGTGIGLAVAWQWDRIAA